METEPNVVGKITAIPTAENETSIIRQILSETLVRLLPILINRYLTDEMIERLIQKAVARIDEV